MKTLFRLYNNQTSGYFDLLEGDRETRQTKGLGFLLSRSELALEAFLGIPAIQSPTGRLEWSSVDQVIVNCELVSDGPRPFRADLLIRFYGHHRKPMLALLIEAKSAALNGAARQARDQLATYLDQRAFRELEPFPQDSILAITLTKDIAYSADEGILSLTWSDLIAAFHPKLAEGEPLFRDFFQFLTKIDNSMQFFEKEVYSIPVNDASMAAIKRFHIYECPNAFPYQAQYKPLYLTFRQSGGGTMDMLYKVTDQFLFNFADDLADFLEDGRYPESVRDRLRQYAEHMLKSSSHWKDALPTDEKQVFILSENKNIMLPHRPRPERNNAFRKYYDLADLFVGE